VRPDADDVYYVSRSVWVAQHGQIPVRDILFTNQAMRPIAGEPIISSIEVLNGALARLFGVSATSFTYYIAVPVLTSLAVWAAWLLIRRWARHRYALCFTVAMVYLAWGGASGASFGSFHLVRIWQGKASVVSIMVPLLYVYLTEWAEHRSKRGLVMVFAAGVAAAGFSSVAVYVVPVIVAAVVVPLLLRQMIREALGAVLALAYPVGAYLVQAALTPQKVVPGVGHSAPEVWGMVLMFGVVGAIGGIALWTAPWLVRRGVPALITTGIAGVATILLVPGVLELLSHSQGLKPTLWRTMWVVPAPVPVGLLATVPLPAAARFPRAAWRLAPVAAAVLCAVLVAFGLPVWSYSNAEATVASRPSWKLNAYWLAGAFMQ
jgi:hypothetical protein